LRDTEEYERDDQECETDRCWEPGAVLVDSFSCEWNEELIWECERREEKAGVEGVEVEEVLCFGWDCGVEDCEEGRLHRGYEFCDEESGVVEAVEE
jgi:hypothetical protein